MRNGEVANLQTTMLRMFYICRVNFEGLFIIHLFLNEKEYLDKPAYRLQEKAFQYLNDQPCLAISYINSHI